MVVFETKAYILPTFFLILERRAFNSFKQGGWHYWMICKFHMTVSKHAQCLGLHN